MAAAYGAPVSDSRRALAAALAGLALATGVAGLARPAGAAAPLPAPGAVSGSWTMPPADARNPTNPLAGRPWGVYRGKADPAWEPYLAATGATKDALGVIAHTPKAKFFGAWIPDGQIAAKVHDYVANATGGDPEVLVQLTLFRMVPWEGEACRRLPTVAEQASYRRFVDATAQALGDTHAAVVLQPDGPFLGCVPGGSTVPADLLAYAVRSLSRQPHVSVYVEMGSADWFRDDPVSAVSMLLAAGVADARGFALDTSHFDSVGRQIAFGRRIVDLLAAAGVPDRHFVIDTSDSGRPFTGAWFRRHHPGARLATAAPCGSATQTHCVALGVPPTTVVADPAWGLSPGRADTAARLVDGYLWVSRPWLVDQSGAFSVQRAVAEVSFSPYA